MGELFHWLEVGVSFILVGFEKLLVWLGMSPASGWTWALSIVGLVITIRVLLIPLFVRQIKSQRAQQILAPELKKIQAKYKGKKDQASREAMSRETIALYQKHKTNPLASCLPLLLQAPIFIALFRTLNYSLKEDGVGWLTPELAKLAREATIFGAGLPDTFQGSTGSATRIVAGVLIAAMVATTFLTQRQITRKNMPKAALEGSMATQMKIMMYAMPFIFILTGPLFPIGVLIYWTTSNLWTMGQQYWVIRRNPTPGSEAEAAFKLRQEEKAARKAERAGIFPLEEPTVDEDLAPRQRQQPTRKNRRKR